MTIFSKISVMCNSFCRLTLCVHNTQGNVKQNYLRQRRTLIWRVVTVHAPGPCLDILISVALISVQYACCTEKSLTLCTVLVRLVSNVIRLKWSVHVRLDFCRCSSTTLRILSADSLYEDYTVRTRKASLNEMTMPPLQW